MIRVSVRGVPMPGRPRRLAVTAMHDITEGGEFGALWEMAGGRRRRAGSAISGQSRIRQETVEICEYFGANRLPDHVQRFHADRGGRRTRHVVEQSGAGRAFTALLWDARPEREWRGSCGTARRDPGLPGQAPGSDQLYRALRQ